jgi:hypothetical protein
MLFISNALLNLARHKDSGGHSKESGLRIKGDRAGGSHLNHASDYKPDEKKSDFGHTRARELPS